MEGSEENIQRDTGRGIPRLPWEHKAEGDVCVWKVQRKCPGRMSFGNVEVYLGENDQQSGVMDKGTNTKENHSRLGYEEEIVSEEGERRTEERAGEEVKEDRWSREATL